MERIPDIEWEWSGFAGHFILSDRCDYRLNTAVGEVVISTVGLLRPRDGGAYENIGGALFETMAFRGHRCAEIGCDCAAMVIDDDASEILTLRANTPKIAHANHMAACEMAARGELDTESA